MLSRAFRRVNVNPLYKSTAVTVSLAKRFQAKAQTNMLCMQCEQTSHGTGCESQGICGKLPETANMQDLLLFVNNGISQYLHTMDESKLDESFRENTRHHMLESVFSTLTNVNFSEDRMVDYIEKSIDIREQIKPKFREIYPQEQEFEKLENNPCNYFIKNKDDLNKDAMRFASLYATKSNIDDENCWGLRECAQYGIKGMVAYFCHAEAMQNDSGGSIYSEKERSDVFGALFGIMNDLNSTSKDLNFWLNLCMKVGETNIFVMELLDRAHNKHFGVAEPTSVSSLPINGKCILLSGHDVLDCKIILECIESLGLSDKINVYTHGELLPAHSYPELKKYGNFAGHFGTAWQNQYKEFKQFPGPIIMTSNCLMPPRRRYKDRLFTAHCMGYDDVKHIDMKNNDDVKSIINKAMECKGFDNESIEKWKETQFVEPHLCGFGHSAILSKADLIINAIKNGDLKHIFYIGGCDGSEKKRSYFHDLGDITPNNSLILTAGCGKFRLRGLDLGDIGDSGIPRILDMGQCNDSYSAIVIAQKLAQELNVDFDQLPLHFAVSWLEQKAVAVFLSMLHLGIKNIRLGPAMPAFLTNDVRKYLFDNLGVKQCNLKNEKMDLEQMINETPTM